MLVALSGGLALPASNKHKHKSLSPKDKDGGRGLWTTDATKASLKNGTAVLLGKSSSEKAVDIDDNTCWMWSDPHVECFEAAEPASFNPEGEDGLDPIHTLAEKPGEYKIQSFHCPVVQETCTKDYYPCGASAAVAYAGTFKDHSGNSHSVVMWGQRVVICEHTTVGNREKEKCYEVDIGTKKKWSPKKWKIGDGCTLERKENRANSGNGDAVRSPGDYETSFDCGGAKLVTWYYDEEHMPTGYLMNALFNIPDEDKGKVSGLCHSTEGPDAAPTTCSTPKVEDIWARHSGVAILSTLSKACGVANIKNCVPVSPSPSPPPLAPSPSPPPPPSPPKLEWGYITDVNSDPDIVDLYDKAVDKQEINFPEGSAADYCVKKDPSCKHKELQENIDAGITKPPWKVRCEETCTACTELVGSCKITEHHTSCKATKTWSDAEADGNQLKEDPDSHLPSGPVTVGFDATVDKKEDTKAEHSCCETLTCVGWYFQTSEIEAPEGTKFRFQYKASKEADWFEIVAALYEHVGDVDRDDKGVAKPKQGKLVKRTVLRGAAMEDFLKDGFKTEKAGKYYLAFFAASYDFTAGAQLGSILTVKSFEYELPGGHVKQSNMLA